MKKTIKSHEEKETKQREEVPEGALPAYLLDREKQSRAKILSNTIKQKRKEKAVSIPSTGAATEWMKHHRFFQGKWDVPIPKVKAVSEAEVFRVVNSGKRRSTRDELIERLFTAIPSRESLETFGHQALLRRWRIHT
jgi:ribosome biogenesis protein NSA2